MFEYGNPNDNQEVTNKVNQDIIETNKNKVKEIIDISMQETAVARKLTVEENIEFYAKLSGLDANQTENAKKYIYEVFGLDTVKNKQAQKLSGGWQRRLSIAMALISEPEILFLDEPTLGLEVLVRSDLWELIRSIKGKVTIILTTHYMEEAEALSDRIAIMKNGRLLICDSAEKIKEAAGADDFEQAFVRLVKGESK